MCDGSTKNSWTSSSDQSALVLSILGRFISHTAVMSAQKKWRIESTDVHSIIVMLMYSLPLSPRKNCAVFFFETKHLLQGAHPIQSPIRLARVLQAGEPRSPKPTTVHRGRHSRWQMNGNSTQEQTALCPRIPSPL